jgi:hypothetical protein
VSTPIRLPLSARQVELIAWLIQIRDIRDKAEVLPPVDSDWFRLSEAEQAKAMDRRSAAEHPCLRCGRPAKAALVAHTAAGDRWLDVCWADYGAIRVANERPLA